jgi:hypothetical protein
MLLPLLCLVDNRPHGDFEVSDFTLEQMAPAARSVKLSNR